MFLFFMHFIFSKYFNGKHVFLLWAEKHDMKIQNNVYSSTTKFLTVWRTNMKIFFVLHYDKYKIFPNLVLTQESEHCLFKNLPLKKKTFPWLLGWQNHVITCSPQFMKQYLEYIIIISLYQSQVFVKMYLAILCLVRILNCPALINNTWTLKITY